MLPLDAIAAKSWRRLRVKFSGLACRVEIVGTDGRAAKINTVRKQTEE